MKEKHFDLIVANDVSSEGIGMGAELNAVVLLSPGGKPEKLGPAHKKFLAVRILDKVAEVMNKKKM
jgi:phosphopantothenoylcysteine decarboxylase/phosphopantothenate--cysteine ligase